MLIAIVALTLVAVFMAQKRNAADQPDLPPPGGVPSQGTSGIPSPGPEQTGNPVGTTRAGYIAALTGAGMVRTPMGKRQAMGALGDPNVNSVPQGPPDQEKSLSTQKTEPQVMSLNGTAFLGGYRRV